MSSSSSSTSSSYNSPCAACKFLRRKCMPGCIFAPYFPPEEPQKFANVHKIFGASNVTKLLNELMPHQREDAVNSLAYEAEARVRDPVYGCVSAISFLQRQIQRLQKELDLANADLLRYACNGISPSSSLPLNSPSVVVPPMMQVATAGSRRRLPPPPPMDQFSGGGRISNNIGDNQGGVFFQTPPYNSLPWEDHNLSGDINGDQGGGGGGGGAY